MATYLICINKERGDQNSKNLESTVYLLTKYSCHSTSPQLNKY